jgi:hypothetical protein
VGKEERSLLRVLSQKLSFSSNRRKSCFERTLFYRLCCAA